MKQVRDVTVKIKDGRVTEFTIDRACMMHCREFTVHSTCERAEVTVTFDVAPSGVDGFKAGE